MKLKQSADNIARYVYTNLEKLQEISSMTEKIELYNNTYLAGGFVASILSDSKVKDFDFFFSNIEYATKFIQRLLNKYVPLLKLSVSFVEDENIKGLFIGSLQGEDLDNKLVSYNNLHKESKDGIIFLSNNAILLKNKIQVVFKFCAEPEVLFNTFDFEHCKVYSRPTSSGLLFSELTFTGKSLESLVEKRLIYSPGQSRFCLSALARLCKFLNRGWSVPPATLLGIVKDVSELDLSSKEVLELQLSSFYGLPPNIVKEALYLAENNQKVDFSKLISILEGF
jgi:hypothetical protein